MPRLSQRMLDRIQPIADAIDEVLKEDEKDRKNLFIRTQKPKQIKGELATFKTNFRRNWIGKFWMVVHKEHLYYGPCIEISFDMKADDPVVKYEIVQDGDMGDARQVEIYSEASKYVITGDKFFKAPIMDLMNDDNILLFILMDDPGTFKVSTDILSMATKKYLEDPSTNDPSTLILGLEKNKRNFEQRGAFLIISKKPSEE